MLRDMIERKLQIKLTNEEFKIMCDILDLAIKILIKRRKLTKIRDIERLFELIK